MQNWYLWDSETLFKWSSKLPFAGLAYNEWMKNALPVYNFNILTSIRNLEWKLDPPTTNIRILMTISDKKTIN